MSRDQQSELEADEARIGAELIGQDGGIDPFVAAVRATRMPMIVTDPRQHDNPVVFVNDAFCRLSGYAREEIVGRNCRFLQGPETDPDTVRRIRAAVGAPEAIEIDIRNHRKNGELFWNRLLLAPVRDAAGRLAYFFASQVDVTLERERLSGLETQNAALVAELSDRLRAQEASEVRTRALLDLDDQFRALDAPAELAFAAAEVLGRTLGVSRAGYGTVDLRAETISIERDWNAPGIETLAGVLHFRDYGSYIDDLRRGETVVVADAGTDPRTASTADALKEISAQALINMPVTEQEGLVALLYLNHATPRRWPQEELAFVREVASRTRMAVERRRAQQDLRSLAATLEAQVAARTAELMQAEAALRQSQKMEAVGQLTGGLAHDFNNLLAGVTGSLELLKVRLAQGRFEDVDRYAAAAQGAAQRAAALTHRLLAFSRRQTLEPKATDVGRLIAGLEDLIRRTVGPAIAVEVAGSGELWNTLVDPSQLENALLNLCINARDAMPDGGRLIVETRNRRLDERGARTRDLVAGEYVSLCVSDTGTGMAPEVAAKAFDPFFTTKPIGQGTGLGLSMIYGFARQSGGQARIHSEPGRGTTVCLYVPRHLGAASDAEAPAELAQAPRAEGGETVLVVDDEPTVRLLVTDVLKELSYTTLEAEDGASGLDVLRSNARIDLLVTDVGLPGGMNGRQVADAARVLRPELKVLFITGYAESAVLSHGHLEPGMQVLVKPFAMEALAARVKDLVSKQWRRQARPQAPLSRPPQRRTRRRRPRLRRPLRRRRAEQGTRRRASWDQTD